MALKVGELFALLKADDTQFNKTMKDAEKTFAFTGRNLSKIGKGMTLGITLPIAGFAAASLNAAKNFESGMSNVKAVSGATEAELESLRKLTLKLGKDTKYSALESAQGIEELLKAGVSIPQVLGGAAAGALDLAAASGLSVAESAEIAAIALNTFKKDNISVAQSADILSGAANASATDVGELKYALSASGSVASMVGLSFKDTATELAVLAQNGLKGSDAGTSLKTMLMNLQPTTKKQREEFQRLNLLTDKGNSLFYDMNGKIKGVSEISQLLQDRMIGMTDAQKVMSLEVMFGSDAIRAASIMMKSGAKDTDAMWESMSKVKAVDVAKTKMDNLTGSVEQMSGSMETLQIRLAESKTGPIRDLVDAFTGLLNKMLEMDDEQLQSMVMWAGVAAAIGPVVWILGGVFSGIGSIIKNGPILAKVFAGAGTAAGTAGTQIGGLTGWIGGLLATTGGVLALGTAFLALYGYIAKVEAKWDKARVTQDAVYGIKEGKDYQSTSSARDRQNGDEGGSTTKRSDAIKKAQDNSSISYDAVESQRLKNQIKVPAMAEGGIVKKPTFALIGEGIEDEVVSPLSKLKGMIQGAIAQQQQQPAVVTHTGTIRVEGINARGQVQEVAEIIMDKMRREVRR